MSPATLVTVDEARQEYLRLQSEGVDRKAETPVFAVFATGQWRESWIPRCKPYTIRGRDRILEAQLLPTFSGLRMDRITPSDIHR